jgi:tetratricopeptide (TPR) repeat protein
MQIVKTKDPSMNKIVKTIQTITVKTIHELSLLVSLSLYRRIEAIRELPLRIIPIILLLTCGTPEQKETKPSIEPVKIKGRIQIDEIKYSGPPKESWIVAGIRDTVTNDLAKVREVEAISIDDQNKALKMISERRKAGEKNLDPSKESAKILAADYLCVGNLQNTGKVLRLNIRLLKAPDFSAEQTATIDGTLDEIFTLQDKVVESLLANVDAKMTQEERLAIEVFTPKNKKAYELYAQGLEIANTNPKKALDLFLQALKLEPDYLDAMNWIGIQYNRLNQVQDSLSYHKKRMKTLEEKNLAKHDTYATTLNNIGLVYASQDKYEEALDYLYQSIKIKSDAFILTNIGSLYNYQRKYDEALKYYFQSKKIEEDHGLVKTANYAVTMNNIGTVYNSQNKYEEALGYHLKSKKIWEDIGLVKTEGNASNLHNLGRVYQDQKKYEEALDYYFQSKKVKEDIGLGKTSDYAATLDRIGLLFLSQGQYVEALKYCLQSKKIREDIGFEKTAGYAFTLNSIGGIYNEKGEPCKAVEWFQKAVTIQEQLGAPSDINNLHAAQQDCDLNKPTNIEQEKKKAIDWIIKNNVWGTKDNAAVQLLTKKINTAIQDKKSIWVAFGKGILKSQKVEEVYWKKNRFSVHDLNEEEVEKMEFGEMDIKSGGFND